MQATLFAYCKFDSFNQDTKILLPFNLNCIIENITFIGKKKFIQKITIRIKIKYGIHRVAAVGMYSYNCRIRSINRYYIHKYITVSRRQYASNACKITCFFLHIYNTTYMITLQKYLLDTFIKYSLNLLWKKLTYNEGIHANASLSYLKVQWRFQRKHIKREAESKW